MYIVLETTTDLEALHSKYLVLELDTLDINGEIVPSYCVVDSAHIPLNEIPQMKSKQALQKELMASYRKQEWDFCQEAIESLIGSFQGELDSFYIHLAKRIVDHKANGVPEDWQGVVLTDKSE